MSGFSPLVIGSIVVILCAGCAQPAGTAPHIEDLLSVRDFGAKGDGKTLDTGAFEKAIKQSVAKKRDGIDVPPGNYLIGSIVLPSNTTLRLDQDATLTGSPNPDDYPLMQVRWEGRWREGHRALIHAKDGQHITIAGDGTINGDMTIGNLRDPRGPCIFEPINCTDVRVEGVRINYKRMWAIHLTYCTNVHVQDLAIRSTMANGDGIDVDSCSNVRIEHCDIDTGDDAIALKSGRGMEAVRIAKPTENVRISDCKLGSSFAGLAFGTEMSGGIRDVHFTRCTFTRGANSIFIKSRTGRGGFIEDIQGQDLSVTGAKAFLRIDLTGRGIQDSEPVEGADAFPRVGNIRISGAQVNTDVLIDAKSIAPEKPVNGLSISQVSGTCKSGITLNNVNGADFHDINVKGPDGDMIPVP